MDAAYPEVPVEMMKIFHLMDRKLYSILVFELERDPMVSVSMIAFWIWLEQNKIKNVVHKIVSLSIKLINELADEAVACLRCITDAMYLFSSDASEISLTQKLLGIQLSLKVFHENRAYALCGIRMVVENVCVKVLDDLMKMAIERNAERQLLKTQIAMDPVIPRFGRLGVIGESSWSVVPPMDPMTPRFGGLIVTGESSRSVVPAMDPMTPRFGGIVVTGESSRSVVPPMDPMTPRFGGLVVTGESSRSVVPPMDPMVRMFGSLRFRDESSQPVVPPIDPMIQWFGGLKLTDESSSQSVMPPPPCMEEPKENRTMFATFTNGYPVSEWELMGYFIGMYGDCVESISMQAVEPNEQSMFAVIVFTSPNIVYLILRGLEKANFTI